MSKGSKRWLFYSAVAVFLLLSYIVILYAQGYKYDFSEGKFFRTGAISLKVNTGAKIFLDDELQGDTSFFNSSYSIDGLLPGTYKLNVQKDGYASWQKTATVEEGFVVDFSNTLLLSEEGEDEQKLFDEVDALFKELEPVPTLKPTSAPKPKISPSPTPEIKDPYILDVKNKKLLRSIEQRLEEIADNVTGFRLSKNNNKLAWWTNNELWVMWLNDQNYQPFYKKGDKELITRFSMQIQNGAWFRGEDHLVLELERFDSKNRPYSIYQVVEIDKRGGVNIVEL
ncbi:MAG: hypothetical protein A3B91_04415 [Candidatus Yanofskybacteria bacterium RIFCSPHIGHO2_02_FULL_41_29]|uniref:PEGA domain-containing protein n=1 Tax=Candidatus Yanofskybacteria bacterium RIFCSPHIGHO2_01_FULL_41_53 TaxID=1802663 RepID=A0A1F8EHX6_9BACT|nr:MAG: hypothetical protein A2650_03675 [Candidatus Yanofskybacteria bacterium RIFCSPHIGHO2_01_FULL_41_53]OGN11764.1 MAG: hypothetical protein A3B91_04415 [Candidatus Yanofskybacteria bacterium RIFCSPHIGHO2_02_FULL_41_29]OGN18861.1 MAG: hypothetical protein A3F48_02040 [Candidatus Yanofskybacteria bacterium RIFCSPHIGHO2_12_FULL_41_9]OGN22918.1 MAG: hypothetical protein A2916_00870 [Candidatus Yanofskybacteria bacterium RIFCSPLOWO2_01_FULL_41_67]OGN30195.1 MAG: hypothetical protein A3H54_00925 